MKEVARTENLDLFLGPPREGCDSASQLHAWSAKAERYHRPPGELSARNPTAAAETPWADVALKLEDAEKFLTLNHRNPKL